MCRFRPVEMIRKQEHHLTYMGVDIGTSGCKAIIFDEKGRQMAAAYREYDVILTSDGGAELISDEVIDKCFSVIRESADQVAPVTVRGLGISSQGEAFTPIGKDGEALFNAMVSSDIRSEPFIGDWLAQFGALKLYQITGHTAHTIFSLFKLLWLKDKHQEVWSRAWKYLCFEDLLQLRLGLDPAISWSLAGRTMLFDVKRHEWSPDILQKLGLRTDQLARLLSPGRKAGIINKRIAVELGLGPDTFVVCGGHDQPCGALGAGVTRPGMAMYATGTVECITAAVNQPIFTNELYQNNLCTFDHTVAGMYTTLAYSLTGGNILKWFKNEFADQDCLLAEEKGINIYEYLMVLPYLTPSGTPYFDTKTRGAVLGLQLSTSRREFMRALLEGVALEMRLNLELLEQSGYRINEMRVIGGGAKSRVWTQLKADIIGKRMITIGETEAGCLGVAMLACSADKNIPVRTLAEEWVQPVSEILPRDEYFRTYTRKFEYYRELYPKIKNIELPS
jgi:xylulokinase